MAGHSHWANIQHKKARVDAKRGKIWTKLAKQIAQAAKSGGGDVDMNASLRLAVDKAKAANMPKDTIERSIKKGTGELAGESFEEIRYEGYGPGGVAIICDILTDNRNRTAPEIKKLFERAGGNLGAPNCVAWMFVQKALIVVPRGSTTEDTVMEVVSNAGADDVEVDDENFEVTCAPARLDDIRSALEQSEITVTSADITLLPTSTVALADAQMAKKVLGLVEALDDHDDVQSVSANFDIPDETLAQVTGG